MDGVIGGVEAANAIVDDTKDYEAAIQAQISAAHAADEVHGLAGVLDHVANDRSQDLTAATVARHLTDRFPRHMPT